jgi:hypothetical protein
MVLLRSGEGGEDGEGQAREFDRWEELEELRDYPLGFQEFDEVLP